MHKAAQPIHPSIPLGSGFAFACLGCVVRAMSILTVRSLSNCRFQHPVFRFVSCNIVHLRRSAPTTHCFFFWFKWGKHCEQLFWHGWWLSEQSRTAAGQTKKKRTFYCCRPALAPYGAGKNSQLIDHSLSFNKHMTLSLAQFVIVSYTLQSRWILHEWICYKSRGLNFPTSTNSVQFAAHRWSLWTKDDRIF